MILSSKSFRLLGLVSLLLILGFLSPAWGWVALGFDLLILTLAAIDGARARRQPVSLKRHGPLTLHQGTRSAWFWQLENPTPQPLEVQLRDPLSPLLTESPCRDQWRAPARSLTTRPFFLIPHLRGSDPLAPIALRVLGPWGLAWATQVFDPGQRIKVFPKVHHEGDTALVLKMALERQVGDNPLFRRGLSTELYALREYRSGDEMRMVHWRATAKRQRPIVRENTWEQNQQLVIMVDCGRPMASRAGAFAKLDHALAAVIALLRVAQSKSDGATLVLFSKEIRRIVRIDRRTTSFQSLFEQIFCEQADLEEPDYPSVAAWCASKVPRRSLALIVTSVVDFGSAERVGRALEVLRARHLPLFVNLNDPTLAQVAESIPEDLVASYAKVSAMSTVVANRELELRLKSHGIDVLTASADRLTIGLIQRYLDIKSQRRL